MTRRLLAAFFVTAAVLVLTTVRADDPAAKTADPQKPDAAAVDPKVQQEEASAKEKLLREEFETFKNEVLKLKQRLETSDKEEDKATVKTLDNVLKEINNQAVDGKFDKVIERLQDPTAFKKIQDATEVAAGNKELHDSMQKLIELLQNGDDNAAKRKEREANEKLMEKLKEILSRQEREITQIERNTKSGQDLAKLQERIKNDTKSTLDPNAGKETKPDFKKSEAKYDSKPGADAKGEAKNDTEGPKGEAKDAKSGEAKEGKPGDDKGGETKDGKPADGKEGDNRDGMKPSDGKGGESKDGMKPADGKEGDKGGESKDGKPSDGKEGGSKDGKPADGKEAGGKGNESDNKESKPSESKDGKGGESKDGKPGDGKSGESKEGKPSESKDGKGGDGKEGKAGEGKEDAKGGDQADKPGAGKEGKAGDGAKSSDGKAGEGKEGGKAGDAKSGEAKAGAGQGDSKPGEGKGNEPKAGAGSETGKPGSGKEGGKPGDGKAGKPGDGKEGKPAEGKAGDGKGGESKDGKPGDGKAGDGKPSESKSGSDSKGQGDGKGEAKTGDPKSDKGAESKPSESKGNPSAGQPSQGQPGQGKGDSGGASDSPPPPPQGPQPKIPVRKQIEDGAKDMEETKKKLDEENKPDALTPAGKAADDIRIAIKKLEEIINQDRQEEIERILERLQARCARMLAMQIAVKEGTVKLDDQIQSVRKAKGDERPLALDSNVLSDREYEIVKEADRALALLENDGSAIAFAEMFQMVRRDMLTVKDRLGQTDTGVVTVAVEDEIIKNLTDMVDALKKQREANKNKDPKSKPMPPGPPRPPGEDPLVDVIAQLKLLRSMQKGLNDRTELYHKEYENNGEQAPAPDSAKDSKERQHYELIQKEMKELGDTESKISKILKDMLTGKNKAD